MQAVLRQVVSDEEEVMKRRRAGSQVREAKETGKGDGYGPA